MIPVRTRYIMIIMPMHDVIVNINNSICLKNPVEEEMGSLVKCHKIVF